MGCGYLLLCRSKPRLKPQVKRFQKDATRQRAVAGGVTVLDGRKSLMTVWSPIRDLGVWGGSTVYLCKW